MHFRIFCVLLFAEKFDILLSYGATISIVINLFNS